MFHVQTSPDPSAETRVPKQKLRFGAFINNVSHLRRGRGQTIVCCHSIVYRLWLLLKTRTTQNTFLISILVTLYSQQCLRSFEPTSPKDKIFYYSTNLPIQRVKEKSFYKAVIYENLEGFFLCFSFITYFHTAPNHEAPPNKIKRETKIFLGYARRSGENCRRSRQRWNWITLGERICQQFGGRGRKCRKLTNYFYFKF